MVKLLRSMMVLAACAAGFLTATGGPAAAAEVPEPFIAMRVTVQTDVRAAAGTDADIHVQLDNQAPPCGRFQLDDRRDNFERGATETFGTFPCDIRLDVRKFGELQKASNGSAWYVNWVKFEISDQYGVRLTVTCHIDDWLPDGGGAKDLEHGQNCHQY